MSQQVTAAISNRHRRITAPHGRAVPRVQTRSLERGLAALEYVAQAGEASVQPEPLTERTITSVARLREELACVRGGTR